MTGFVVFQLVWPLRHFTQTGNSNWTEVGHRFAWHMMLRGKRCGIRYYAADPDTGKKQPIDLRPYLTEFQVTRFGRDPEMIRYLARFIDNDFRRQGRLNTAIHVLAFVSLNGRKPQLMVDPTVDLRSLATSWRWGRPSWVVPLSEPLREHAWNVPLDQWARHLALPSFLTK